MIRLSDALKKLTPIDEKDLRQVLTRTRLQAIQDAILLLADGENLTAARPLRKSKGLGGGRVKLDVLWPKPYSNEKVVPLKLRDSRPTYMPASPPPGEGERLVWMEWGSINNTVATNWNEPLALSADRYLYADITLNQWSSTEMITSWELASGTSVPTIPEWPASSPSEPLRPDKYYILLGYYHHESGIVSNEGGGSIMMAEHAHDIGGDYSTLGTYLKKSISYIRLNY